MGWWVGGLRVVCRTVGGLVDGWLSRGTGDGISTAVVCWLRVLLSPDEMPVPPPPTVSMVMHDYL